MPSKSNGYGEERQHHPGRQVGRHAFEPDGTPTQFDSDGFRKDGFRSDGSPKPRYEPIRGVDY